MSRPKAYDPEQGYYAQLLCRYRCSEWEHCDYATDRSDLEHLQREYALAYSGTGMEIKSILLPKKYWDKAVVEADRKARREKFLAARRAARQTMVVNAQGQLDVFYTPQN